MTRRPRAGALHCTMARNCIIDIESRSTLDLRETGVYPYAHYPTTDLWCVSFAMCDGRGPITELTRWHPGDGSDTNARRLASVLADPDILCYAHNAAFERVMLASILTHRYGFPEVPLKRWRCTLAMCANMGLPRSLDAATQALGLDQQKDNAGHRLMLRMARPRRTNDDGSLVWWDDEDRVSRLGDYCDQDVIAEHALFQSVPDLTDSELRVYQEDQRINDRGIMLDRELIDSIDAGAEVAYESVNSELYEITSGLVANAQHREGILNFVQGRGIDLGGSLAKAGLQNALKDNPEADPTARRVIELRLQGAKTSLAKTTKMRHSLDNDGRSKGALQYYAAGTGRLGGRLWQPQNLPARSSTLGASFDAKKWEPLVRSHSFDTIDAVYPLTEVLSQSIRPCIRAAPGNTLIGADYNAIEARVVAWLAGEEWLLEAFRNQADPYRAMAEDIYHTPADQIAKNSFERQVSKMAVLGCIAEGSPVLTNEGLVPIESVKRRHLLWDGVEWVAHEGVIDKGVKDVIIYDGIEGTPDHPVFTYEFGQIPLGVAASRLATTIETGEGGDAIRLVAGDTQKAARSRVYDILNAGPRHRFTVSGRLVHNCGFGMGAKRFLNQLIDAGIGEGVGLDESQRIVDTYRERNARIKSLWGELDNAALSAVRNPTKSFRCAGGRVTWRMFHNWLLMILPSRQRALAYYAPRIRESETPWGSMQDHVVFWGQDTLTRKYKWIKGYGGLWAENLTQATARDILITGISNLESNDWPVIMTVHDEIIAEPPQSKADSIADPVTHFEELMCDAPAWADGCPLAAEGWMDQQYWK